MIEPQDLKEFSPESAGTQEPSPVKDPAPYTVTDAECYRLSGLKTNLQGQIATVLGYIKKDTQTLVTQIQNRSHHETLRIMNLSMSLVHQLDEVATMRACKFNSDNPVARALCRNKVELFNELEFFLERKGIFEYKGVDVHEGPKVKIYMPYLESCSRTPHDLVASSADASKSERSSLSSSALSRKVPLYAQPDANLESRTSYFIDYDKRHLVKVDAEAATFERVSTRISQRVGAWGSVCRLPDKSIFHYAGKMYPASDVCEYYVLSENFIETRTLPPSESVSYQGSVYYNGSVFLFGGIGQQQVPLRTAVRYSLNEGTLDQLKPLPQVSGFTACCVVGDCVLVTGYHMDKLYGYVPEDDEYIKLLDVPPREYKVIFTAFSKVYLLCGESVYEAVMSSVDQWKRTGTLPRGLSTVLSPPTRTGQSVYFMAGRNELWKFSLRNNEVTRARYEGVN